MSDDKAEDASREEEIATLVTPDEFASVDLAALLSDLQSADDHAVEDRLFSCANAADEKGEISKARVCRLLAQILSIAIKIDTPSNPFGPMIIMDGKRSLIPDDLAGEQTAILATLAPALPHRSLRAKVGDVAFYNQRKHHAAAAAAIVAYCEIARGRLTDTIAPRFPELGNSIRDVVAPLTRATYLMRLTRKRGDVPSEVRQALEECYALARDGVHYLAFTEIAEIGWRHSLLTPDAIAADAEAIASAAPPGTYPEAVKRVWILAGECHAALGNDNASNRCYIEAAEQTLKMRDESDQASVKAHWTKAAIGELRALKGVNSRVAVLRDELRQFQAASLDDLSSFFTPIDLSEDHAAIERIFDGICFSDACLHFANMAAPPSVKELHETVLELARKNPLSASISASYYDNEGKETARVEAMPFDQDPSQDWYKAKSIEHLNIAMLQQVRGKIEVARAMVMNRWPVQDRHLLPIVEHSPFIPVGRHAIYLRGFACMFQGDYLTACHLLFPQLENSLRHVLMLHNQDPSKIEQDLIQGDRTLSTMLDINRDELELIFGEDTVHQIDILFNFRPGPSLRNEQAHGKLPVGAFHHDPAKYACWFTFCLVTGPLFRVWKERIAPLLEAEASF